MWVADTSWLYALFNDADTFHSKARQEAAELEPLLVDPVILAEFLILVKKRKGHNLAFQMFEGLTNMPTVRLVKAPNAHAIARVCHKHQSLSWPDGSAVSTALDEGAGLRSFDAAQRKAFEALR